MPCPRPPSLPSHSARAIEQSRREMIHPEAPRLDGDRRRGGRGRRPGRGRASTSMSMGRLAPHTTSMPPSSCAHSIAWLNGVPPMMSARTRTLPHSASMTSALRRRLRSKSAAFASVSGIATMWDRHPATMSAALFKPGAALAVSGDEYPDHLCATPCTPHGIRCLGRLDSTCSYRVSHLKFDDITRIGGVNFAAGTCRRDTARGRIPTVCESWNASTLRTDSPSMQRGTRSA